MLSSTLAAHLQHQIEAQLELAALATLDKIRAMHEDLEKLYRAQLVAVLLAERLEAPRVFPAQRAARAVAVMETHP